ncbi:MAG: Uma2 family endonuclease [Candidatus Rokuibacteriota bacterium]
MAVDIQRRRFTVEEYHRLGVAGIFTEDDRVELIDGEIIQMTPIGSPHAACVDRLTRLFVLAAGQRASVRVQSPISLGSHSESQPDLTLLRPRADFYASAHPGPADIWLIVEVADTSLRFDRTVKIPLYARAAIPEVWLVDLAGACVELYRRPSAGRYEDVQRATRGEHLTCQAFPDVSAGVDEILG